MAGNHLLSSRIEWYAGGKLIAMQITSTASYTSGMAASTLQCSVYTQKYLMND
jgi:hypothetical protein